MRLYSKGIWIGFTAVFCLLSLTGIGQAKCKLNVDRANWLAAGTENFKKYTCRKPMCENRAYVTYKFHSPMKLATHQLSVDMRRGGVRTSSPLSGLKAYRQVGVSGKLYEALEIYIDSHPSTGVYALRSYAKDKSIALKNLKMAKLVISCKPL